MRARRFLKLTFAALTILAVSAAPAGAEVPHTVQPGETLWTIAAANNLTTNALAVFNGLSADSQVVLGSHDQGADDGRGRRGARRGRAPHRRSRGAARLADRRRAADRRRSAATPSSPVTR